MLRCLGGFEIAALTGAYAAVKDSRLGTYGAAGLIGILGVKFAALHALASTSTVTTVGVVGVFAHTLSRQLASHVVDVSTYVQDRNASKIKPIASSGLSTRARAFAWATVIAAGLPVAVTTPLVVSSAVAAVAIAWVFRRRVEQHIGGYTGDTLGATQQLAEVATYIAAAALIAS